MSGVLGAETILLMLVHFFGDFYGAFYYPLVPYFRERFGLTLTAIGALAALLTSCRATSSRWPGWSKTAWARAAR